MRKFSFLCSIVVASAALMAQGTLHQNNENQYYRFGLELFGKQKYSAAREQFERYLAVGTEEIKKADAAYYIAYCALNLNNPDGTQLISDFVARYPNHPKAAKAYYNLGINAFDARDFQTANKYLKQGNTGVLSTLERAEANFKIAYSAFSLNNKEESIEYFELAKREESPYFADANYYSGFLAYIDRHYDKVLVDLKRAAASDKYKFRVPVMLASAYYQQKRYQEVVDYVSDFKDVEALSNKVDYLYQIYQIAAESAYALKDYEAAVEYYGLYRQIAGKRITEPTLYRIGYSNFVLGNTDEAIVHFKRVALKEDTLAQYASYYLGRLYVKKENYLFATSAFDKAAKSPFNPQIQEESAFSSAKLAFETKKYSRAIVALDRFMKAYPASEYIPEASNLLSEAFLNTNDFSRAITFIERIKGKTPRMKEAYQKVTFYQGTAYFNKAKYQTAIQLFNKSLLYRPDKNLETAAQFWKGEAQATAGKYSAAIDAYQKVFQTRNRSSAYFLKANYGIAYAYYNIRDYSNARIFLKRYVEALQNAENRLNYNDAILRLADCYYVDKEYATAISYYQRAIDNNNPNTDYAYFQKGVVRDFQNKSDEAIEALEVVISRYNRSRYYDDAIYKKAQIQLEGNRYREAIQGFTRIIERLDQSPFIPYAYESRALAYFNLNELEKAEEDYKAILNEYVTSRVAKSALLGLQNTLNLSGKVLEFDQYLTKYRKANPDNKSLETIELDAAKNKYFGQAYEAAIGALEDYEKNYEESPLRHQAKFYRAESYYRLNNVEKALELYYELDRESQVNDMDVVFQRIGALQLKSGDFQEAANYYARLESVAKSKRQENDAWVGLMDAYFKLGEYPTMRNYANNILTKGGISRDATNRAQLYLGKAAYSEGDFDEAIDQLLTTINLAQDQYGAEAKYMLGQIFYQKKQYQKSLNTLFEFSETFAGYDEWLGKAFLLIADNYIAMEELFQAKGTVNSIIENSSVQSVVDEAKARLAVIEKLGQVRPLKEAAQDTTQNKGGNK